MHDDHRHIEALRRNDPAGIREIYRLYSNQALRWVVRNQGTSDDARDVFQEALMALYEKSLEPGFILTCPLGALLHIIYSRKWIDRLRQKGREAEVRETEKSRYSFEVVEDAATLAEEALTAQAQQSRLAEAFAELSELCRNMLKLLGSGTAPREVAAQLQMNSVDTLYRRKNACMQRWREVYQRVQSAA
jgi:RNA polymerase sigma factor (sigma-70 family)